MSDSVRDNNVIFQTGSQQRSDPQFRYVCELARNGYLGDVKTVICGLPGGTPDFSRNGKKTATEPVPDGFNYDMWLGPAPEAPYCPARCHVNWRLSSRIGVQAAQASRSTANTIPQGKDFRVGHNHGFETSDLIVWIRVESVEPIMVTVSSHVK